jgi:hypothetical protein
LEFIDDSDDLDGVDRGGDKLRGLARGELHFDRLDRYQGAAALVMTVGSFCMMLFALFSLGPLWLGFLMGAVPALLLASLIHAALI